MVGKTRKGGRGDQVAEQKMRIQTIDACGRGFSPERRLHSMAGIRSAEGGQFFRRSGDE